MRRDFLIALLLAPASFSALRTNGCGLQTNEKGNSIGVVNYSVGYDLGNYVSPTTLLNADDEKKKGFVEHEQMTLDVGTKTAHFYSYVVFQNDSLMQERNAIRTLSESNIGTQDYETFTDYPAAGQYSMTDKVARELYLLQEQMPIADWELCPDSSATVLGYSCRMAKTNFLGREWSAWYAEDIPLDTGPWLLRGLPGLILRAYTADGLFRFEANGLEKGNGRKPIYYKGGECEKLNREQLRSLYYRYHTDPIGYINSNTKIRIQILDENRNEVKRQMKLEYHLLDKTLQKE